jgi:hypothetical protein
MATILAEAYSLYFSAYNAVFTDCNIYFYLKNQKEKQEKCR